MAETLPSLRYPIYANYTEAVDLGGGSNHTWVSDDGGSPEERAFIRYDFTASEGYSARMEDCSVEGQAIKFEYDLAGSVYAGKRQFVLGAYAYLLDKSMSFSGKLPDGEADCFLTGTNEARRIRLLRSLSEDSLAEGEHFLADLSTGSYQPVDMMYIYPRPGVTGSGLIVDETYSAYAEVRFSGVEGEFPPYLDVVAEDVIPSVTGVHPANSFADPTEPITLSWQMTYDELRYAKFEGIDKSASIVGRVYGTLTQKSARVRWTKDGETIHEIEVGSEGQCVLPAGIVGSEGFQWQVDVCTSDGVWSDSGDQWYQVNCTDDSLSTAVAVSPKKVIIDGTVANVFRWEHYNESGSKSHRADLQYSTDGVEWNFFAGTMGSLNYCTIDSGIFPAGQIWWRVRTYNASNVAGEWSEPVPLTVRSAPAAPTAVLVGETPQPEISWNSADQIAAEVQIGGKHQRVYGKIYKLRWPEILADGVHTVGVRVQNLYGLWSDWAEVSVKIINYPQGNFQLSNDIVNDSVRLRWNRSFEIVQVFRGEKRIAELTERQLEYVDHGSNGVVNYRLRGITEEGYYSDSNMIQAALLPRGALLGKAGEQVEWIPLKGRYKAIPIHTCRSEQRQLIRHYAALKWPQLFPKEQWNADHQLSFSIGTEQLDLLEKIRALSGSQVIYKDARGELIHGILTEVLFVHRGLYVDIDFHIIEGKLEEGAAR